MIVVDSFRTNPPASGGLAALGGHAITGQIDTAGTSPITAAITAQASGSTLLYVIGAYDGILDAGAASDGVDTYTQVGSRVHYTGFPGSGIDVFNCLTATGGSLTLSKVKNSGHTADEATLSFVEVKNANTVSTSISVSASGSTNTSGSVTVPAGKTATLVAWHFGDNGTVTNATPGGGFTTIDAYIPSAAVVQCIVAAQDNVGAGTYTITWTNASAQGALLVLIAAWS